MVFDDTDKLHGSPDVGTLAGRVDRGVDTVVEFLTEAGFEKNDDWMWELTGDSDPAGWLQTGRSLLVELDTDPEQSGVDVYAVEVATDRDDTIVREDYAVDLLKEYAYGNTEIDFQ